jgi:hypothetical protein
MPRARTNPVLPGSGTYVNKVERALRVIHENARKGATAMNSYETRCKYLDNLASAVLEVARVFRAARWNKAATAAHDDVLSDAWLVVTTNVDAASPRGGASEMQERKAFRALENSSAALLDLIPSMEADLAEMRRRMR